MSDKPTSAVTGVTNVVKQINAALATIERDITVTVTRVNSDGQSSSADLTGLTDALRGVGLQ